MKELKKKIEKILDFNNGWCGNHRVDRLSDKILSSPTNLRAERECKQWGKPDCLPECKGECDKNGIISRPLTLQEKLEIPDMLFDGRAYIQYVDDSRNKIIYIVKSGERIVIARDKEE